MEKNPHKRLQTGAEVVARLAPWATDSVASAVKESEPAAARQSGPMRPILVTQDDTEPGMFDDLSIGNDESPSQISQYTDAVASGRHETLPDIGHEPLANPAHVGVPTWLGVAVLVPLLLAALLLVVSLILKAVE
jgi:hypothetical protein